MAVGLYNTKPLTSKLRNSCCIPAKHLQLRRWYLIMLLLQSMAPSGYSHNLQAPKLWMQQISTCVQTKPLELRYSCCSMLLLQCLAAGLYNTKPLTSKLRNSSCVPAKPLELRRWYLIMLLLQRMAPSGYSRNPQAPKLWMQQISTCVPAKP